MSKRQCSSSISFVESSKQQDPQSQEDYTTREEQLEQQRSEILSQSIIVEREIAIADFEEIKLATDRSEKSITKARAQTEQPAWVDAMVIELKESIWIIVKPMHTLYKDFHTRLTILENNFSLTERGLREEVIAMWMELTSMKKHVSQLYQSLSIVPIQLRMLIKRVDIIEERLEHVCDAIEQDLNEPARCRDSN
ncbi:hypothetical protein CJ030_MR7G014389 [Morella rubra]|uniref:Uncharacterized protein n=1 Tax=Morella rubra TaxID=262757 RepID=A0A6A1V0L8_9ROSI|nr:hypothetical protein CJ030_MR7G014379 [Morella rubra]KAB1206244.1 hypothetical protein CJ030_MR7G014389 [Morella rubra]